MKNLLTPFAFALLSLSACQTPGTGPTAPPELAKLLPFLETFADAAVRLHLTAAVHEKAPALFAVLDADHDGELTLAELKTADLKDPKLVTAVLLTIERLLTKSP